MDLILLIEFSIYGLFNYFAIITFTPSSSNRSFKARGRASSVISISTLDISQILPKPLLPSFVESASRITSEATFSIESVTRASATKAVVTPPSASNPSQLKKALAKLNAELDAKTQQIATLQTELASKNIRIAELDDVVAGLNENVKDLIAENEVKSATVASQDKALNTAWFVYGTKSELKEQKIISSKLLQKTKVLENDDFNKDYFTQIDIRTDKTIKLYSKTAEFLTTHPEGTYELVKDNEGLLTLSIVNPNKFWSVSRYLVILVK